MSGPQNRRRRILAATYRLFGEAAIWTSAGGGDAVPAVVRPTQRDQVEGFGVAEVLMRTQLLLVRAEEVASPAEDDVVEITRDTGVVRYRLIGEPRSQKHGLEWLCEAKTVP